MHVETDLTATAILGPWVKPASSTGRRQQVYLSLAHWYEAAKFMPHRPELRDTLLYCPSVKEARKFARKRQKDWRSDWPVTRHSVLVAGMAMLCIQRPELQLHEAPLASIRAGLAPLELPERFLDACLERFEIWRSSPKLSVFGADVAPDAVVGTRLAKLVSPLPTWTLVTSCHKRTPWRVHDWALAHYVPVAYLGSTTERPSRPLANTIIEASDQVLVFERRRNKRLDHILQTAKSLKKKVVLELFDGEDLPSAQLPIV
jgi:hypothetical protein